MKKLASLFLVAAFVFSFSVSFALAQAPTNPLVPQGDINAGNIGQEGPVSTTSALTDMIVTIVYWIAWIIAVLAVIFGLYAAILFITGGDSEDQRNKAKSILIYAVVGIVVALIAFAIVSIVRGAFNL